MPAGVSVLPVPAFRVSYVWVQVTLSPAPSEPLVIVGVLNSVVSIFYYLRVTVALYMEEPTRATHGEPVSALGSAAAFAMVLLTLGFGIAPEGCLNAAKKTVSVWAPATVAQATTAPGLPLSTEENHHFVTWLIQETFGYHPDQLTLF